MDFAKEQIQSGKEALDMAKGQLEPAAVISANQSQLALIPRGNYMKTFPISTIPSQLDELLDNAEHEPVLLTNQNQNEPEFAILSREHYEKLIQRAEDNQSK